MATVTIVATADLANVPPRVRLDVTDSGTPAISSVTVTRTDNSGAAVTVKTSDGNPLQLVTSGSTRIATIYDYDMPYGSPVQYSTLESPGSVASVTVAVTRSWLIDPGVPGRSVPVEFRVDSFAEETRAVNAGVFYPMGRTNAIVITDGRRRGPQSSFTAGTETLQELAALLALLDGAGVLLLNVPTTSLMGMAPTYISAQNVTVKRRSNIGTDPMRDVVIPYVVVDRPVGGSQSQWTWQNVIDKYATWAALMAANPTWAQLQAPTS